MNLLSSYHRFFIITINFPSFFFRCLLDNGDVYHNDEKSMTCLKVHTR